MFDYPSLEDVGLGPRLILPFALFLVSPGSLRWSAGITTIKDPRLPIDCFLTTNRTPQIH
jgi:hypothetical protein